MQGLAVTGFVGEHGIADLADKQRGRLDAVSNLPAVRMILSGRPSASASVYCRDRRSEQQNAFPDTTIAPAADGLMHISYVPHRSVNPLQWSTRLQNPEAFAD